MADPNKKEETGLVDTFRSSQNPFISFAREALWVVAVVGGIALVLYLASGTWPAVVTIESESMVPHMNVGDLVFVAAADRYGELQTWESGHDTGYSKFGDYGDVLIYSPNGAPGSIIPGLGTGVHPIIHRAMGTTAAGSQIPVYYYFFMGKASPSRYLSVTVTNNAWVLPDGRIVATIQNGIIVPERENVTPVEGYIVPSEQISRNGGYITKGDNNVRSDQGSYLSRSELGIVQPVKDEWVVGKALFAIPLLGYIPLNIIPVAIFLIVVMALWEYFQRRNTNRSANKKPKKKR